MENKKDIFYNLAKMAAAATSAKSLYVTKAQFDEIVKHPNKINVFVDGREIKIV